MSEDAETIGENPCLGCGGTELPLHTDGMCADCHELDAEVDEHGPDYGYGVPS
jgi:hypothetical protein